MTNSRNYISIPFILSQEACDGAWTRHVNHANFFNRNINQTITAQLHGGKEIEKFF
jgi:hypothetical protein